MVSSVSVCWISEPLILSSEASGPGRAFGLGGEHAQQRDLKRTQINLDLRQFVAEAHVLNQRATIRFRLFGDVLQALDDALAAAHTNDTGALVAEQELGVSPALVLFADAIADPAP